MAESQSVELGFVDEATPSWQLRSKFFPSKIGGSPAWLRLNNLLKRSSLLCSKCNRPLQFLLQVYAPIPDVEAAFHRTLFLFFCATKNCNPDFIAYRNQLPRKNDFYSFEPPKYNEKTSLDPSAQKYQSLCCVCGCVAEVKCPNCPEDYCSTDHLTSDRRKHQKICNQKETDLGLVKKNGFLLPELDICTETEKLPVAVKEKSDEEKMKEYSKFMQSARAPKEMQDLPLDDLDDVMKRKDKAFNKFKKRVDIEPDQVLRYQRGGEPLWVSSEQVPRLQDIPDCPCGARRGFEFQVMPQLLNYLKLDTGLDSVDWGTLAVYTCSSSCQLGEENYIQEFVWRQNFSAEENK